MRLKQNWEQKSQTKALFYKKKLEKFEDTDEEINKNIQKEKRNESLMFLEWAQHPQMRESLSENRVPMSKGQRDRNKQLYPLFLPQVPGDYLLCRQLQQTGLLTNQQLGSNQCVEAATCLTSANFPENNTQSPINVNMVFKNIVFRF